MIPSRSVHFSELVYIYATSHSFLEFILRNRRDSVQPSSWKSIQSTPQGVLDDALLCLLVFKNNYQDYNTNYIVK